MIIAIWTTKTPKVEGIKEAVESYPPLFWIEIEYVLKKVESCVSDMPLSLEETMQWAKNRARNLKKLWITADYYVWPEWWTWDIEWTKYLGGLIYIEDKNEEWHYWFSNMIEVPTLITKKLYVEWWDLWPIMSELSGITNIQSKNWAMWALSDDMLNRKDQFVKSFYSAISPFFNKYYKL